MAPRVPGWLSFRDGAGACKTCAAVGPDQPLITDTLLGLRSGGVAEPASTGNSSALGSLWGFCAATGFLSVRCPLVSGLLL